MIYLSNPAADGANEMPRRDMNESSADGMPVTTGEMPTGSMTDGPATMGAQLPSAAGEMPVGAMMDIPAGSTNQMPTGGEMPTGSMHQAAANTANAAGQTNPFELSGSWKLQITVNSLNAK